MLAPDEKFDCYRESVLDDFEVGGKPLKRKVSRKKTNLDQTRPIDENEQDQIISELLQDAERLSLKGRRYFHYLFLFISGIYGVTLLYSIRYRMVMEHQVLAQPNQWTWKAITVLNCLLLIDFHVDAPSSNSFFYRCSAEVFHELRARVGLPRLLCRVCDVLHLIGYICEGERSGPNVSFFISQSSNRPIKSCL